MLLSIRGNDQQAIDSGSAQFKGRDGQKKLAKKVRLSRETRN